MSHWESSQPGDVDHKRLMVVDDMRTMVQSALDFVRGTDSNEVPKKVNMTALVESLCEDLREEGFPVQFNADDGVYLLNCRPVAFRRGLHNIIDNAIKYGQRAEVFLKGQEKGFIITVNDSGPGIPEQQLENVLKPFFRLEKDKSSATGGLGLGLLIAQTIFQAHGGNLTLANQPKTGLRVDISFNT